MASPTIAPAAAADADSTFSFAVIPDTQNETYAGEVRMQKRVQWLLANRQNLDLRWVLHSGDVHNWDTPNHEQFAAMSEWLRPIETAGLPLILTVGNHDTAAVCPGGSACPGQNTNLALRDTSTWNAYYPPARFGFNGVFQAGKSDNGWRTFSAGGKDWLVLSVELWPRTEVINWARQVVATHPQHNVIVVTHAFLESDGRLSTSNGGYGANSPATLWNALDDYPNVVMTFSGHVGAAANTSLTGVDGHRVATFLQAFHDPALNPTRIVTVDTAAGTISTRILANYNRSTQTDVNFEYTNYRATISGMRFVGAPSVRLDSAPAVASWAPGRLDVFAKGVDGQLWHRWFQGGWSGWEPLGGSLDGAPAVASWASGRLDVFVRGIDGQLWHRGFEGGWSGWEPLGGLLDGAPAVASWASGRLDVFVRGIDGQLWHRGFEGGWSGWEPLGGRLDGAPAVASWASGRLDVFVRGIDGQLWHRWFQGAWSGWEPLGGRLDGAPAVASWASGRLDVFAKGIDGQLWHRWFQGAWSGWEPLGGLLDGAPAVASWASGRLDVFARGIDGQLWRRWFEGGWSGWGPVPG